MKVRYLNSFDRSFDDLDPKSQNRVVRAVDSLLEYFETGKKPQGLGLRKLRDPYWEIRAGLKIRIIFSLEGDLLSFILVGDHSDIKRYLHHR